MLRDLLESKSIKEKKGLYDVFMKIALENIDGLTYEDAEYYLGNDADPSSGSVSGLINSKDLKKIAVDNYDEIVDYIEDIYGSEVPIDVIREFDNLVWAAWHSFVVGNMDAILDTAEKEGYLEEE